LIDGSKIPALCCLCDSRARTDAVFLKEIVGREI